MCYRALAVAKAVSFITRVPAFLKNVSDARIRDDARPSVRPSAMNPTLFAVFFASVWDRKTERKSEIDGIGSSAGAVHRVRENNDVDGSRGVYYIPIQPVTRMCVYDIRRKYVWLNDVCGFVEKT